MASKLTAKQQAFCEEYMIDLNATQAAKRAGYGEKNAKQQGTENLANPSIQEELARLKSERSERTEITADEVLRDIVTIKDTCIKNGKSNPALKALEMLGRHLGLFPTSKLELTGVGGGPVQIEASPIDLTKLSDTDLKELKRLTDKANGNPDARAD